MEFTEELIDTLFERCKQHCLAKHNIEIDHIQIENGYICGYHSWTCYGQSDYETIGISIDEINNTDYDVLISERLERERIQKEKDREEARQRQIQANQRKEREEREKYLELKKKFENQ